MREIKFRALTLDGQLVRDIRQIEFFIDDTIIVINEIPVKQLIQYANRKDKNKKEIYEGDLIKATLPERGGETFGDPYYEPPVPFWSEKVIIGEVRIRTCGGVGMIVRKIQAEKKDENIKHNPLKVGSFMRIDKQDEIIGNIYENPGLLKGGNK